MDEQRIQVYARLIEQLLSCPQGQEAALLQANTELLDADLLTEMEQYATYLESQDNNNAIQLRGVAAKLAQVLVLETAAPANLRNTAQFLKETLQLIAEDQGSQQQIYPLWIQQQTQFNERLLAMLPTVVEHWFASNADQQMVMAALATLLVGFGNLINQFPFGTRWLNLELGIAAYQQALTVRTQAAMPIEWAETMNNLAVAYSDRIRGDRAENIEQAINYLQQSLTVRTQAAMPIEWAETMMNLAVIYYSRIRGDRAENIEQAIDYYQQALTVRTQTVMPLEWTQVLNNLAIAYYSRIRGDRAENIEQAIDYCQQTLTVATQATMPVEWSTTMVNLAIAYHSRIWGDRAENIEQAIDYYQQALTVTTQTMMPLRAHF